MKLRKVMLTLIFAMALFLMGCANAEKGNGNHKNADSIKGYSEADGKNTVKIEIKESELLPLSNVTEIDGFSIEGVGWSQVGIVLNQEQKDLFVPGSVVQITYSSDYPIWLVAMKTFDASASNSIIVRAINENTYENEGLVKLTDPEEGIYTIQYPYEVLEKYFGSNFKDYLMMLQCEGQCDYKVYGLSVGMREE